MTSPKPRFPDASLIVNLAAANQGSQIIPIPTTVSLFQFRRPTIDQETVELLPAPLRKAGSLLRNALSNSRELIVLTSNTAPTTTLAVIADATVAALGYERVRISNIVHLTAFLEDFGFLTVSKARDDPTSRFIIIVEDSHLVSEAFLQSLQIAVTKLVCDKLQIILTGRSDLRARLDAPGYSGLSAKIGAEVDVIIEKVEKPVPNVENDLLRAWKQAEATSPVTLLSTQGATTVSPHPALAALLGQVSLDRPVQHPRRKLVIAAVALVLCGLGYTATFHHDQIMNAIRGID